MKFFAVLVVLFVMSGSVTASEPGKPVWQPPYAKAKMFSRHVPDRCSIYGNGYAYFHCAIILSATQARPEPKISSMSVANTRTIRNRRKPQALALLRVAASTPPEVPVIAKAACSNSMDSCYTSCKREGGMPDVCNRTCTTDWICAAPLRMTYGQYLDFQIEMLASNTKR